MWRWGGREIVYSAKQLGGGNDYNDQAVLKPIRLFIIVSSIRYFIQYNICLHKKKKINYHFQKNGLPPSLKTKFYCGVNNIQQCVCVFRVYTDRKST